MRHVDKPLGRFLILFSMNVCSTKCLCMSDIENTSVGEIFLNTRVFVLFKTCVFKPPPIFRSQIHFYRRQVVSEPEVLSCEDAEERRFIRK